MTTYVVGDIQGCFKPFQCLLERVEFDPSIDIVWSVGDLINRGPDNLKTLRWFYEHRDSVVVVLGNHDLHLMAVAAGALEKCPSPTTSEIFWKHLTETRSYHGFANNHSLIMNTE